MKQSVILDASALLAAIFEEAGVEAVRTALKSSSVYMTTVNIAEVATKMLREGYTQEEIETLLPAMPIIPIEVDEALAYSTAFCDSHTKKFGLSLGDRICLAAARRWNYTAFTADQSWNKIKLDDIKIKMIR